jgi:hypothetical protein
MQLKAALRFFAEISLIALATPAQLQQSNALQTVLSKQCIQATIGADGILSVKEAIRLQGGGVYAILNEIIRPDLDSLRFASVVVFFVANFADTFFPSARMQISLKPLR